MISSISQAFINCADHLHSHLSNFLLACDIQSAGRQFLGRRKEKTVFGQIDSSSDVSTVSEIAAVQRSIAMLYLALPTGSVIMGPSGEHAEASDPFLLLTGLHRHYLIQ
jgi:hypothetical protein